MIDQETLDLRNTALTLASGYVDKIVDAFEPEPYEIIQHGANIFATAPRTTRTPGEQTVDMLLDVGSWLLGEMRP